MDHDRPMTGPAADPAVHAIRVLVADDHVIVREGVVSMLRGQADITVVGEACSGEEAVLLFRSLLPNVLLLDLSMPGIGGCEALRQIREEFPNAKVIVLTVRDSADDVRRALDAGAAGYLLKDVGAERLATAIRNVDGGIQDVPEELLRSAESARSDMTEREMEVLQLAARGFSNREIGLFLAVPEGAVKTHLAGLFAKLDARDRTEAVTNALKRGILHLS